MSNSAFILECVRPDLPFAFAARDTHAAWAYASCGHVIHQREQFVLGEILVQREVPGRSFGFWDRTMGHLAHPCSLCSFLHIKDLIVCAMCGSLIGINFPICVLEYHGGYANNPYLQYATRVKGHERWVITCPYARCCSPMPQLSGRWIGNSVRVQARSLYV